MENMRRDEMSERVFATVAMARRYCAVVVLKPYNEDNNMADALVTIMYSDIDTFKLKRAKLVSFFSPWLLNRWV